MRRYHETFRLWEYLLFAVVTLAVLCLCVCIGSVRVPLGDTLAFFAAKLTGGALPEGLVSSIMPIRLPRVLCVAVTGAALSLAGAAMQGLLKNPLADGSTLGVSSGASLGAVCAIAFGVTLPGFPFAGTMVMAILFAFGSLLVILGLSYKLDRSLSTNTIILIGVCVSIGGTIGFVGLVTPHMARMLVGPNHRRLLPAAMFGGAVFLMLADLVARTLLNPLELPIGVVTSFVGAIVFVVIFYQSRKEH